MKCKCMALFSFAGMRPLNKKLILVIASMGIFVEALDIAIVNLALPEIQKGLGLSSNESYQLQSLYVLTYGGLLILGGKLSDFLGRKRVFLAGAVLFLLTSLGAGLSHHFAPLIFFRVVQGMSAALLMPSAFSIVTFYFSEPFERSRAVGVFSSFAAIGSASGLSVGGIITTVMGWSWVFLINVPVLAVIIVIALLVLEDDAPVQGRFPDIWGAIALVVTMLCLTWCTELLAAPAAHVWELVVLLSVMVTAAAYLYRRLLTQAAPLLDIKLLFLHSVKKGNTLFVLLGGLFTGYLFMMSYLMQQYFQFSAAAAGLIMMPFNILSVLVARFVLPVIAKRFTSTEIATAGAIAMCAGTLLLVGAVHFHSLALLMLGGACVAGIGMTLCFTGYSVLAMQQVPEQHLGVGGSLNTTAYLVGGGIGLPFIAANMTSAGVFSARSLWILFALAVVSLLLLRKDATQRHDS